MTSRAAWEEREAGKRASAWVTLERLAEEGLAVSVDLSSARRVDDFHIQPFLQEETFIPGHQHRQVVHCVHNGQPHFSQFGSRGHDCSLILIP